MMLTTPWHMLTMTKTHTKTNTKTLKDKDRRKLSLKGDTMQPIGENRSAAEH